ncbi:MAG TPA: hypothetical protein VFO10_25815 [Oligoflexus sp.]|uniref:hypothetical protein n=1 Tax=Oligoflexus sp. TaxID=1971216 RepID=UPI002D80C3F2|nr:hypothetical protein [Oligoflexus sp.]HET9240707.1 hypothetical protein [Oligoflexus sp.]
MLLNLLLSSCVLMLSLVACDEKDSKNPEAPRPRTEIPLNTQAELVGVWSHCNPATENTSTSGTYTFTAEGGLLFKSTAFQALDCQGEGKELLVLEGQYLVGQSNALDLTFGKGKAQTTVYRVFSVQGKRLLISNNAVVGSTAENRDWDLGGEALVLNKLEL